MITTYNNSELVILIIKELFLITYNLFQYIWYILYYTYYYFRLVRKWFESPNEQHEIKVLTAGLIFTIIVITLLYKINRKEYKASIELEKQELFYKKELEKIEKLNNKEIERLDKMVVKLEKVKNIMLKKNNNTINDNETKENSKNKINNITKEKIVVIHYPFIIIGTIISTFLILSRN
jgi:hypothetical protein